MADSKVSALTALAGSGLALGDLFLVSDVSAGVSKSISAQELLNVLGVYRSALAADATANATTTAAKITGLDLAVPVGIYQFQYFIRYVSSIITTGVKFSVNYSGTVTSFLVNMRYVDVSAAASTGAPSQAANASTAQVMGAYSARAKSNAAGMGPTLSTDTTGDMFIVIEGLMVVTVAGNMELYHASETAASTTVKAGSSLSLIKCG